MVLVAAALLAATPSPAADGAVVVLGKRVGEWTIGSPYRVAAGRMRTVPRPENLGYGCTIGPRTAVRIDYYRGLRLSWRSAEIGKAFLSEAATTRRGDRTTRGLVIGRSTFAHARRLYPQARVYRGAHDRFALGATVISVYRRTGYEAGEYLELWFDKRGRLAALATGVSGC